MTEYISNVNDKYIIAEEANYGVKPTMTQIDFGLMQNIAITEDESLVPVSAINTGHTLASIEDGVYTGSITLTSWPTRAGLRALLKALFGKETDDLPTPGKYTIEADPVNSDDLSYYMQVTDTSGKLWDISGIHFTEGTIKVSKGAINEVSLTGAFKKATKSTATISPQTNVDNVFHFLDAYVEVDGDSKDLDDFTLSLNWNRKAEDSRGIEEVGAGERRLIQRIIRHNLSVTGNFTAKLDDDNTGYVETRVPQTIVVVMSRNSNTHTFTVTGIKTTNRGNEFKSEAGLKVYTTDFTAVNASVVGDIFDLGES